MSDRLSAYAGISNIVFRVALSLIFIVGGLGHFVQDDVMMARILASPWYDLVVSIADPALLLYLSGGVLLIAGVMLLAGFVTRIACLLLFVTLVPITLVIHIAPDHVGPLLKNVAILGALVHFFVHGAGAYAIDGRLGNLTKADSPVLYRLVGIFETNDSAQQ